MSTFTEKPKRVTASDPCKHCRKGDHPCSRYSGGTVSICYNVAGPGSIEREDKSGKTFYIYGLDDRGDQVDAGNEAGGPTPERAADEDLHEVYSAVLGLLSLSIAHERAMLERGFGEGQAARLGYRTLPAKGRDEMIVSLASRFGVRALRSIPGFFVNKGNKVKFSSLPGLLIPARDKQGRIIALTSRPDERLDGGNKYLWVSSKSKEGPGPGAPVHVPLGQDDKVERMMVTEGLIKSDLTQALSGVPTLGNPGVGNWTGAIPILKAKGVRTVCIAYDRDWREKVEVAKALVKFSGALVKAGFAVEVATWDDEAKGIDDLLASGGKPTIHTGKEAEAIVSEARRIAEGLEQAAALDLAARVRAKVETDGVAGLLRDKVLLAELATLEDDDPGEYGAILASLKKVRGFAVKEFKAAIRRAKPEDAHEQPPHPYHEKDGGLFAGLERLTNFTARIKEEIVRDDGSGDNSIEFKVEAEASGGVKIEVDLAADEFEGMGWVVPKLGARAIIEAGRGVKDQVRVAIQHLSGNVPRRTVFTHTGWRKIGGESKFLHAGGAIGSGGLDRSASVDLGDSLANFDLPSPPEGAMLIKAIRAHLGILKLGNPVRPSSRPLAAISIAAPYRAAIGGVKFGIKFTGPTGSFKSSVAALIQQPFGRLMNLDNLPFNWESTANSLESDLHSAKDTIAVVDEFVPGGSAADVAQAQKKADRIVRSQGNRQARSRMTVDRKVTAGNPPRGMLVSTGEDGFQKQSANARTLPVPFASGGSKGGRPGTVDIDVLTACQGDANAGLYAASMAAYLQWIAPRYEQVLASLPDKVAELRAIAYRTGDHRRTPEIVAELMAGFEVFLEFAVDSKAIELDEAGQLTKTVWLGLLEASAEARAENLDEGTPVERYLRFLASAMNNSHAHLVDHSSGEHPEGREALCGWTRKLKYQGNNAEGGRVQDYEWEPSSNKIGWVDHECVYLIPDIAYKTAAKMATSGGGSSLPTHAQLKQQLHAEGKLAKIDSRVHTEGVCRFASRETLEGSRVSVLVIKIDDLFGSDEEPAAEQEGHLKIKVGEVA